MVLIIMLLVALILPVLTTARKHSYQAICISNMRQIHTAWMLYIGDYGGSVTDTTCWPKWQSLIPYIKDNRVLICHSDPVHGWWRLLGEEPDSSYAFLEPPMAADVLRLDPNPGIVGCFLHGQCRMRHTPLCKGLVLRIRADGSLGRGRFLLLCFPNGHGWTSWYFFTDAPCPPRYRLGGIPCDPPSW